MIEQAASQARRSPQLLAVLAHSYATAGKREQAERTSAELTESANRRFVSFHELAIASLGLGDPDSTLTLLERAADQRTPAITRIAVHPLFDVLRREERFINIGRRMGLL